MEGITEAGTGGGRGTGSFVRWRQRVALPVQFRLAAQVEVLTQDECWLWQGRINEDGYGQLKVSGRYKYAHRLMYGQIHGGVPEGRDVHHTCHNRACLNPRHLVALTRSEHAKQPGHVAETKPKTLWSYRVVKKPGQEWRDVLAECKALETDLQRQYGG